MGAVRLREGESAAEFRAAAAAAKDANQARRLLSLAAIRDGMSRTEAARIGGMDRQTLRDWVHAYNEHGIEGLINATSPGRPPKLSPDHKAEIKALVEKGPNLGPMASCVGGASTWPALPKSALGSKSTRTLSAACCVSSVFPTSQCARSIPIRRMMQSPTLKKIAREAL